MMAQDLLNRGHPNVSVNFWCSFSFMKEENVMKKRLILIGVLATFLFVGLSVQAHSPQPAHPKHEWKNVPHDIKAMVKAMNQRSLNFILKKFMLENNIPSERVVELGLRVLHHNFQPSMLPPADGGAAVTHPYGDPSGDVSTEAKPFVEDLKPMTFEPCLAITPFDSRALRLIILSLMDSMEVPIDDFRSYADTMVNSTNLMPVEFCAPGCGGHGSHPDGHAPHGDGHNNPQGDGHKDPQGQGHKDPNQKDPNKQPGHTGTQLNQVNIDHLNR